MSFPLVSVVVSAYNRPEFLRAGLKSVLEQSYSNLQIIVQDDSREGGCELVVSELAEPRITYTRNRPSLGTIQNLLAGYRRCSGKYICTLNDDDIYTPAYIQTMVAALEENPECCLAFCDHFIVNDAGDVDQKETDINSSRFGRDRLQGGVILQPLETALIVKSVPGMFALYRRELMDFSDFPAEVSSGYDFWLTYLAVRSGQPMYYVPQRLTSYRIHAASQTSSFLDPKQKLRSLAYDLFTHRRFLADSRLKSIHPAVTSHVQQIYTSIGSTKLRMGKRREAVSAFWTAMRLQPGLRPLAGMALAAVPTALSRVAMKQRKMEAEALR